MQYPPGTQVWVKCDDGVWWPGRVLETDAEMQAFLCDGEDCCVEFYHNRGELFPVLSTDATRVQPFHGQPAARSAPEASWFVVQEVQAAVASALRAYLPPSAASAHTAPLESSAVKSPDASTDTTSRPFTAAELRNVHALLGAVSGPTAAHIRQQLRGANVAGSASDLRRAEARERQTRKRQRAATATAKSTVRLCLSPPPLQETPVTLPPPKVRSEEATNSPSARSPASASPSVEGGQLPFVPAVRQRVLDVLRQEVFENRDRFVLSPIYKFVDLLGAVVVENCTLTTTLPSPYATRQTPAEGFAESRRVLLVPLTESYEHTVGWMIPTEVEGVRLSMSLYIDDAPVPLPSNWQLSPAKEAAAVKTAIAVDVTEAVLRTRGDLFPLQVVFEGDVEEMEMWRGVIACIFVEEVGVARLGEGIITTYRKPRLSPSSSSLSRGDRGVVAMTEASVKIRCPITTLVMEIPVRGMSCEHMQCMELAAVLIQCVRQNIWNCPLCYAPLMPSDIFVNYRLKDWIGSHPRQLSAVEYVVETEPGLPLKVVCRREPPRHTAAVEVIDDDDD